MHRIWPYLDARIDDSWKLALGADFLISSPIQQLGKQLKSKYESECVSPDPNEIFRAFNLCPFPAVRVVILGQDPYFNGQADGLAFSVKPPPARRACSVARVTETGMPAAQESVTQEDGSFQLPTAMTKILAEVRRNLNELTSDPTRRPTVCLGTIENGNLSDWASQGVLLLNTLLTVGCKPLSHASLGWPQFTDKVIQTISMKSEKVVYMLWGVKAKRKKELVTRYGNHHCILEDRHPRIGLHGGNFRAANLCLESIGQEPICWNPYSSVTAHSPRPA